MKYMISIALAIIALAAPLVASDLQIELEPEQSSVGLRLQATLHSVHGTVGVASGSMRLDTESGIAMGKVTVDATTAQTGNKKRDKKMHAKVLRTAEHPWILLLPRRLEGSLAQPGSSDVVLHGEIEILGRSHEISIPLHIEISDGQFTADGSFDVPYVEWGLEDPSTFVLRVAKVVEITIEAAGAVAATD
jgi:polyisoprenoid-binding protein YceI